MMNEKQTWVVASRVLLDTGKEVYTKREIKAETGSEAANTIKRHLAYEYDVLWQQVTPFAVWIKGQRPIKQK